MIDKSMQWLRRNWWGLVVAYLILAVGTYFVVWQLAEPLGIPGSIEVLPRFVESRVFIHLMLTVIFAAHFTLMLDLYIRRQITSISGDQITSVIRRCEDTDYCTVRRIQSSDELGSVFSIPDNTDKKNYLEALAKSECLLEGHFRLVSGKHSSRFIRYREILENLGSREY